MGKASHQPPGLALPRGKVPALRVVPMPADSNQNGDIFGGWIMAQVDVAGGIVAGRMARGREEATVVKVTEAALTYVAIDLKGKPRPVPK